MPVSRNFSFRPGQEPLAYRTDVESIGMIMNYRSIITAGFILALFMFACKNRETAETPASLAAPAEKAADAKKLYEMHCAECHHPERYGLVGPPLLPEYFGRKKREEVRKIIENGLPATNMPSFRDILTDEETDKILSYILSPIEKPEWGMKQMRLSWELYYTGLERKEPQYDMTNFFMIVEGGEGRVHFMDGDSFKLLGDIRVGAIHGGPKFGRDLKDAYIVTRGGWVVKYDLVNLRETGKIRGGISTRNIAVSADGKYLAQANLLPKNIVILDTDTMKPKRVIDPEATVGAVFSLRKRKSFVVSLRDKSEILLIDDATFNIRRILIDQPFTDFFIDPGERYLVGTARGSKHLSIVDIESGKMVQKLATEGGMPHLASAAVWSDGKGTYAAFPHIGVPRITVIEMYTWKVTGEIETKGAGFFARTHENIPQIWVDNGTDSIELIDKNTLKVVGELVPRKDKRAMHVEFTKNGSHALVSVWEDDGEVVVYDTKDLSVVKRMPFKKPVGKYNATNKRF